MNAETELISVKGEKSFVKLEGKEDTSDQKPELHQSYELAVNNSKTKRNCVKIRIKSTTPKVPKCQKRGRKKQPLQTHSAPIPIQPKIFPTNLSYRLFTVPSSSVSQLNQIEHVKREESAIKPSAEESQILNLLPLQSQACDASSGLGTNGNSILFQVCGSHLASHPSNEVGSSNTVVSQLPRILLTTSELIGCEVQPSKTSPLQLSLMGNADKGQIQVQPTQSPPVFQSSLCPVFVGHSDKNCTNNKIVIQMASDQKDQSRSIIHKKSSLCPVLPCQSKTSESIQFSFTHSVTNCSLNSVKITSSPSKLNSTCPTIVVQPLTPPIHMTRNSETPSNNSLHIQKVDSCKILSASIVSTEKKSPNCKSKDQMLQCFDVKTSSSACLKTKFKDPKGRHLNSYPVAAENPIVIQPLLVEHSEILPVQSSKPDLMLKNVKSTRRGRQKRIPVKRHVPVPIQPKILPKSQNEVQISVSDCQALNVALPIQLEVVSCDLNSCGQNSCGRKPEYPDVASSQIQTSQSSEVSPCIENHTAFNSLHSNPTIHGQIMLKSSIASSQLSSPQKSVKRNIPESSLLSEFQKKLKTCKTSNQNLLKHENMEQKTSLPTSYSSVETESDKLSSSQSMLPDKTRDLMSSCPQLTTALCKDKFANNSGQNSARRFVLKRNTSYQKSEKDTFMFASGNSSKRAEGNSSCNTVGKATRKTLPLNETSHPANFLNDSNTDCSNIAFESKSIGVLQPQEKTSRLIPILPRPTNNHTCIFNQAVGHEGRRLWDYLFKKKIARKIHRNLSMPCQGVDKKRKKLSSKTNNKELFHKNHLDDQKCFVWLDILKTE